jgi:hypothetical protein
MCREFEGAGFPFQIESLEDGVHDGDPRSRRSPKQTIGLVRPRTSTKDRSITSMVRSLRQRFRGKAKNERQLRQVLFQSPYHAAVLPLPAGPEAAKSRFGFSRPFGQINGLPPDPHFLIV